ncbi:HAMP domain-containing sensor histidine kinase [Aliihoeflea sp. 40Bstr573]|uniref:sensor histidine kinase n=1 Tax=Aliihoeflea sp. 40Bstr573 TaxID=2696467 RepID=UPI00209554E6|nr:HAMP domain-containing sensor histidine kinase [Aliihoeflea sp. 40Bstr573]MCO6388613.1 HAMP domain-containing protein [Aliihoeflea sp. 40Bstr573]
MLSSVSTLMKTTAARLSALYLLLFAICAVGLVFYMGSLTMRMLTGQIQDTVSEEVLSLGRAYQRGGLTTLVRVVESRSRQPGAYLYIIADPTGRILSGNVQSLEPRVLSTEGWTERPFSYERYGEADTRTGDVPAAREGPHTAMAVVMRLPNQMILLVGRDLGEPERFGNVIRRALIVAFGMMGLGALVIWFLVGRRALKRIDNISDASRRIMGGDLAGRLPVTGAGDEFDRLSQNLNEMLARIGALNEGLKQVSDNIAHDLKTPLTRLRNRAEAALGGGNDPQHRAALEATIAESDQLIRTFNAILMISRLESGYSAEHTAPIDLAAIVSDVVELYEPAAEEVGVALSADAPRELSITGNRELIGQSLSNIVDNAIKYSAGSGPVPTVRVTAERRGGEIVVSVCDNGPGIPKEEHARATERFVRLEQSRSQPGSGLGLSLAKAVMTFHGGRLELSDENPGLCVSMIFPAGDSPVP